MQTAFDYASLQNYPDPNPFFFFPLQPLFASSYLKHPQPLGNSLLKLFATSQEIQMPALREK